MGLTNIRIDGIAIMLIMIPMGMIPNAAVTQVFPALPIPMAKVQNAQKIAPKATNRKNSPNPILFNTEMGSPFLYK